MLSTRAGGAMQQRANWNLDAARWTVVEIGAVSFGLYLAWLAAFERGLEPLVRRLWGRVIGCDIVWVPAGLFRVWGSKHSIPRSREGAIALVGSLFVVASAAVPVVAFHFAAVALEVDGGPIQATIYLVSAPVMMIFVLRVLRRHAEAK